MNTTEESLVTVLSTPTILSDGQPFEMPKLKAIESDPELDTYIDPTPFVLGDDDEDDDLDDSPRDSYRWSSPSDLLQFS